MNNVNLIGRMVKDVELKKTEAGKSVITFSIAVDAGKDKAYFIDCVAWDSKAEQISENIKKGERIGVSGILTTRSWQDSSGNSRKTTEVLVLTFDYLSPKNKKEEPEAPTAAEEKPVAEAMGDGLPFEL